MGPPSFILGSISYKCIWNNAKYYLLPLGGSAGAHMRHNYMVFKRMIGLRNSLIEIDCRTIFIDFFVTIKMVQNHLDNHKLLHDVS